MLRRIEYKVFVCLFLQLLSSAAAMEVAYKSSWIKVDITQDFGFHKSVSERIAGARVKHTGISDSSNIACFGITVRSEREGSPGVFNEFFVAFPKLFHSSYNVPEDNPIFENDGTHIIAISDMFRGASLSGGAKKHNLCAFMLWIQSKPHAVTWDLKEDLQSTLQCIEHGKANEMARITSPNEKFKFLHYLLHCEQLFLYEFLKNETCLDVLFNKLQGVNAFNALLDGKHKSLEFFLKYVHTMICALSVMNLMHAY